MASRSDKNNSVNKKFKVISMFSGCGGLDLGFRGDFSIFGTKYKKLPFEIVWANDMNAAACRTYKRNHKHEINCGNVWDFIGTMPKNADIIIGGFPCQDISINGKMAGVSGEKSGLYRAMVEAVKIVKPKMFIAENVKGLLMKSHKESLDKVISDFESLGYKLQYQLYNASDYGVPQNRERVIIVGTLPGASNFIPPSPTHQNKRLTALDALKDLEKLPETVEFNHIWSKANATADQGSRKLKADKPGQTIRAECHGNIQFHYKLPRRISMREAARIQTFPDNFIFEAGIREIERQVGNAVPPVLGWHIAKAVLESLESKSEKSITKTTRRSESVQIAMDI
ncbi:MAG: DNA cytosine methyltransferase [Pseudobdellovibrio sp.]